MLERAVSMLGFRSAWGCDMGKRYDTTFFPGGSGVVCSTMQCRCYIVYIRKSMMTSIAAQSVLRDLPSITARSKRQRARVAKYDLDRRSIPLGSQIVKPRLKSQDIPKTVHDLKGILVLCISHVKGSEVPCLWVRHSASNVSLFLVQLP
jgi:hypothetical protein